MTFDFNQPLKGLDGKEVMAGDQPLTLGKLLGNQLASANKGDALKLFNWAMKVYNGEAIDLDESDTNTLKEFIKQNDQLTILAKAQLLSVLK
jgi:hypothetical protein